MIEITCNYKDIKKDKEIITAKQLASMLDVKLPGINLDDIREEDYVLFKMTPKYVKNDRHNNNMERSMKGITTQTTINHQDVHGTIFIRYYKTKVEKGPNNTEYRPPKLRVITGKVSRKYPIRSLEEIIMTILDKHCKSSPFADGRGDYVYELYDDAKVRNANLDKFRLKKDMMIEVDELDIALLKAKMAGMKVNGFNLSISHNDSENQIRSKALEALEGNFDQFIAQWNDPAINIKGFIIDAITKGIIITEDQGVDRIMKFAPSFHEGARLMNGHTNENPVDIVYRYAAENWRIFHQQVNDAKAQQSMKKAAPDFKLGSKPEDVNDLEIIFDMTASQLVNLATEKGFIGFNESTGDVAYVKKDGSFGAVLNQVGKDTQDWKEEFIAYLASDVENKAKFTKGLRMKLIQSSSKES